MLPQHTQEETVRKRLAHTTCGKLALLAKGVGILYL